MKHEVYCIANKTFSMDEFEKHFKEAKNLGATSMKFEVSADPLWRFEWVRFYKDLSDSEAAEVTALQKQLEDIKNKIDNLTAPTA